MCESDARGSRVSLGKEQNRQKQNHKEKQTSLAPISMARWPWSRPLPPPPPPPPALYELILAWAPPLWLCCCACCFALVACVLAWAWRVAERFHWRWPVSPRGLRKLLGTVFRLLVQKRACQLGQLTGLALPIRASDLTGPGGAAALDAMLRHGGHLPAGTRVSAVQLADGPGVTDGVKGDKHVLLVSYAGLSSVPVTLPPPPSQLFAKFGIGRRLHPMRVLSDCTETARCEATFYAQVATEAESCGLGSPTCYFADYCQSTGESCLLLEVSPSPFLFFPFSFIRLKPKHRRELFATRGELPPPLFIFLFLGHGPTTCQSFLLDTSPPRRRRCPEWSGWSGAFSLPLLGPIHFF